MRRLAPLALATGLLFLSPCSPRQVPLPDHPTSLAAATDFAWDRVFIFAPYTRFETIESALGMRWADAERTRIDERDDVALLVFMRGHEVAAFALHPRDRGHFSYVQAPAGLTPEQAVFIDRGWVLELTPTPSDTTDSDPSRSSGAARAGRTRAGGP